MKKSIELPWRLHLRQGAHRWDVSGRDETLLLKGEELACCRGLSSKSRLSALETVFIEESVHAGGSYRGLMLNRISAFAIDLFVLATLFISCLLVLVNFFPNFISQNLWLITPPNGFLFIFAASYLLVCCFNMAFGTSLGMWLSRLCWEHTKQKTLSDYAWKLPLVFILARRKLTVNSKHAKHRPFIIVLLLVWFSLSVVIFIAESFLLMSYAGEIISHQIYQDGSVWKAFIAGRLSSLLSLSNEQMIQGVIFEDYEMSYVIGTISLPYLLYVVLIVSLFIVRWSLFLNAYIIFSYLIFAYFYGQSLDLQPNGVTDRSRTDVQIGLFLILDPAFAFLPDLARC